MNKNMRATDLKSILHLLCWILAFQFIGWLMGGLSQNGIDSWYASLSKSPLTPPDITFGIVWSILYVFLAIIGFWVFRQKHSQSHKIKVLYASQMVLNWSWTPVFFYFHMMHLAAIIIFLMVILNAYLCYVINKQSKSIAALCIIYQLWITFALYLNLYISIVN